jgi:HEAT repeat protein
MPAIEPVRKLVRLEPEPLVRAAAAKTIGDLGDTIALGDLEFAKQQIALVN